MQDLSPLGYYNATHTFESTPPFTVPAGWVNSSGTNCSAYVAPAGPTLGSHQTVMVLDDQSASTAALATMVAPAPITSGSVEYWFATSDLASPSTCGYLYDAGETGAATYLYVNSSGLHAWSGGTAQFVQAVAPNTWYHLRVAFDCIYNNYSIYVDGVLRQWEFSFQSNIASVHHMQFNTSMTGNGYVLCVDALDFSSDPAYFTGRSSYVLLRQNASFPAIDTYAFRFVLNSSGADYAGAWTSFDVVAWSGPQNLVASGSMYQVDLAWDPFTNTGGNPVTGYKVYRGATSGAESYLATLGNVTTYHDPGLLTRTQYFYTVTALSALGETPFSGEASALPVTEPFAPQSLAATPGNRSVNLTWAPPADTGGPWVTNYTIYRGLTSGTETFLATVGNTTLTYNDTGLTNGLSFYYQVSANNSVGEGPRAGEVSATPRTTASAPQNPGITAGDGYLDLSWVTPASTGGATITGYNIYRGTASGVLSLRASIAPASTYRDNTVANGIRYYYVVAAVNAAGEGQNATEAAGTPTQPLQLATALTDDGVRLTWNALPYVTTYKLYRSTDPHFDYRLWEPIVTLTDATYTDVLALAGNAYYYQVVGFNAGAEFVVASDVKLAYKTGGGTPFDPMVLVIPGIAAGAVVVAWVVYRARNKVPRIRHRGL